MVALFLWMRFTMMAVLGAGVFLPTALSGQGEAGGTLPGCYDVRVGTWEGMAGDQPDSLLYSPPSRIILDSVSPLQPRFDGERAVRVAPDALPSIHELMSWTVSNDTLILGFSTGFTGFVARLPLSEEGLRGRASTFTDVMPSPRYTADFQLVPVDCDTPPAPTERHGKRP